MSNLSSKIQEGVNYYSKIRTVFVAIFVTIISIVLIMLGIYLNNSTYKYKNTAEAVVIDKKCELLNKQCEYVLNFTVNNQLIETTINSQKILQINEKIKISYDPENVYDVRITSENTKIIGYILISVSIIIFLLSWINVWTSVNYEFTTNSSPVIRIVI